MEVQQIKYERTGGFTGIRLSADFDPNDLPDEQIRPLLDLLDEMDFDELPEQLTGSSSMPDQFTYEITVKTTQWEHTVIAGDASAPDKLQELAHLLDRIARTRRKQ
jgi:hypothetical protein